MPIPCDYKKFLSTYGNTHKREHLWGIFTAALCEAQSLSVPWWRVIIEVVYDPEMSIPRWSAFPTEARINTPELEINNEGALVHELFHSTYDCSPIYNVSVNNREWGEGFCDAFRYFIEKEFFQRESIFYQKIDPYLREKEIKKMLALPEENKTWQTLYAIPAALIIKKSVNYEGFKKIWEDLNQTDTDTELDSYFNFSCTG